jgi:hypothetical protein
MCLPALEISDEPDAASVVLVRRIIQALDLGTACCSHFYESSFQGYEKEPGSRVCAKLQAPYSIPVSPNNRAGASVFISFPLPENSKGHHPSSLDDGLLV